MTTNVYGRGLLLKTEPPSNLSPLKGGMFSKQNVGMRKQPLDPPR